jgi:hypothetical protein
LPLPKTPVDFPIIDLCFVGYEESGQKTEEGTGHNAKRWLTAPKNIVQRNEMLAAWDSLFWRAQQADACLTTLQLVTVNRKRKTMEFWTTQSRAFPMGISKTKRIGEQKGIWNRMMNCRNSQQPRFKCKMALSTASVPGTGERGNEG